MATFSSINDAMGDIGGMLKSPSQTSLSAITSYGQQLTTAGAINKTAFKAGFIDSGYAEHEAEAYTAILHNVDSFSSNLTTCGSQAQSMMDGAITDYVKNTGIQEAGRELNKTIGNVSGAVDCVAGFATLFSSKAIFDDALGLTDLPQLQSRLQSVIRDATNPSKISAMVINLDAIQNLLNAGQGMCDMLNEGLDALVSKDLAALTATLNKLAQFAAVAKLATSDPCSLVTNNMLLNHVTSPVMDDLIDLYGAVTSGDIAGTLGDILLPEGIPGAGILDEISQAVGTSLPSFENYVSGSGIGDLAIGSEFTAGILAGKNVLNDSLSQFESMKDMVEFDSALDNISSVAVDGVELAEEQLAAFLDPLHDSASSFFDEATSTFESLTDINFMGGALPTPSSSGADPAGAGAPAPVSKLRTALGSVQNKGTAVADVAVGISFDPSKAGRDAIDKVATGASAYVTDATNALSLSVEGGAVQQLLKTGNQNFDEVSNTFKSAISSGNWGKISIGSCYGMPHALNATQCAAAGGRWKSQSGAPGSLVSKSHVASIGRTVSKRALTVESVLPTSKAFDVSKLIS